MDTLRLSAPKPLMIAHRGCSGLEMENTAVAFEAAGQRSYWGIETDVHVTRDGQYIIIHDDTTRRVTTVNLPVEGTDYDTLRALRLKSLDGRPLAPGQGLPSLREYVRICKRYDKFSVLELKNPMEPRHVDGIVDLIREEGWLERTVFISFALPNLIRLRALLPEQKAQLLVERPLYGLPEILRQHHLDLDVAEPLISEPLVRLLRAQGTDVNVWTVDDPANARRFAAWGVRYITSNILE